MWPTTPRKGTLVISEHVDYAKELLQKLALALALLVELGFSLDDLAEMLP